MEYCYWSICFAPLKASETNIFGFSEFISSIALLVIAWTIADARYRFRINVAPLPLRKVTFFVVIALGVLTLLTEIWLAENWLVPIGPVFTTALWQAFLGGAFFMTFVVWVWFAFLRPPIFGASNAHRFHQTLYVSIIKGNISELAIIADELANSAEQIIKHTPREIDFLKHQDGEQKFTRAQVNAYNIILLIADKRFCRSIIASSPRTIVELFMAMNKLKKYTGTISTFARNIINEALVDPGSFLFHEADPYDVGSIGYYKPVTHSIFANYNMVEDIGGLLDPYHWQHRNWSKNSWEAYSRISIISLKSYVSSDYKPHPTTLMRAISNIVSSTSGLRSLNGTGNSILETKEYECFSIALNFFEEAIKVLEDVDIPRLVPLRPNRNNINLYDHLARAIFDLICNTSCIKHPQWVSNELQRNEIWYRFIKSPDLSGRVGRLIKFKIRRLIYDDIRRLERFPNYKGARLIAFCLNVFGFPTVTTRDDRDILTIEKVLFSWLTKNYDWLRHENIEIANECLPEDFSFDEENSVLVHYIPAKGMRKIPWKNHHKVDVFDPQTDNATEDKQ